MTNGVCVVVEGDWWHLWLVAWLCHPHVCLFVIHHKWHSLRMPTFCCTTPVGWQEDLVTCHDALVDCFVTTPFLPFQPHLSPLLSQVIHFFSHPLLPACFEMKFGTNSMVLPSVSSSFFPFQWFMVLALQYCEVSMGPFFFFYHSQSIMWASVRVPTDNMPTTQSPKREVGTIVLWPQAKAC